ncbi:MAG: enoyl-CoA hydratase/isomerase family protein [Candidatus Lambdaproteobacteria bacterium]|nr:enoyl-CoA hydratase/isomerase family protein [Candidatus Lambdaproteobacteria bacterium]
MIEHYKQFQRLLFEYKEHGVLLITINRPEVLNATDAQLHLELSTVWPAVDADPETRVAVITGAGRAFCAGGDIDMLEGQAGNFPAIAGLLKEAGDIVYNVVNMQKPLVSAINGPALGGGLAVALLADISIIAEDARFADVHHRLGVACGDFAVMIWPLLCGMAKTKYYLFTAEFLDGNEAERIGLVSDCDPGERVVARALEIADRLATGPQMALRWTKRALNNWMRVQSPSYDFSLAAEMLNFFSEDARESIQAVIEKRKPNFPSAQ